MAALSDVAERAMREIKVSPSPLKVIERRVGRARARRRRNQLAATGAGLVAALALVVSLALPATAPPSRVVTVGSGPLRAVWTKIGRYPLPEEAQLTSFASVGSTMFAGGQVTWTCTVHFAGPCPPDDLQPTTYGRAGVWASVSGGPWKQVWEAPMPHHVTTGPTLVQHDGSVLLFASGGEWRSSRGTRLVPVKMSVTLPDIAWAVSLGDHVLVMADTASTPVWTSTDGVHWQRGRLSSANTELSSVTVDGSEFLASGSLGSQRRPEVCHSSDGAHWTCVAVPLKRGGSASVAASGDQEVAAGFGIPASLLFSTDGGPWTQATLPYERGASPMPPVVGTQNGFVVPITTGCVETKQDDVDCSGARNELWYSADGARWQVLGGDSGPGSDGGLVQLHGLDGRVLVTTPAPLEHPWLWQLSIS
jgi:hypothetical protein